MLTSVLGSLVKEKKNYIEFFFKLLKGRLHKSQNFYTLFNFLTSALAEAFSIKERKYGLDEKFSVKDSSH
jgi:hypothetical protein